jgi:hypothetical protein
VSAAEAPTSDERETLRRLVSAWWEARNAPEATRECFRIGGIGILDPVQLFHPGFLNHSIEIPQAHLKSLMTLEFVNFEPRPAANFVTLRPSAFILFDAQDGPP